MKIHWHWQPARWSKTVHWAKSTFFCTDCLTNQHFFAGHFCRPNGASPRRPSTEDGYASDTTLLLSGMEDDPLVADSPSPQYSTPFAVNSTHRYHYLSPFHFSQSQKITLVTLFLCVRFGADRWQFLSSAASIGAFRRRRRPSCPTAAQARSARCAIRAMAAAARATTRSWPPSCPASSRSVGKSQTPRSTASGRLLLSRERTSSSKTTGGWSPRP
jgi:hypothetical protein